MNTTHNTTLAHSVWPGSNALLRGVVFAILGSLLLAIAAKTKIAIEPVPVTMQVFVVLALGLALGAKTAAASVLLYLAQGAAGLPVFTGTPEKGIGIAYMVGPTGGYLLGFLLAAMFVGWLADQGFSSRIWTAALACLAGVALIYIPGVLWLCALFGFKQSIVMAGTWPFIVPDLMKAALAALLIPASWRLVKRDI
jgi:biotin transport system substrate-specific component